LHFYRRNLNDILGLENLFCLKLNSEDFFKCMLHVLRPAEGVRSENAIFS